MAKRRGSRRSGGRRKTSQNASLLGGPQTTKMERALVDTYSAIKCPARHPEFLALPPMRKWLVVTLTVTANTNTAVLASNYFQVSFATSQYRYFMLHRVMIYTNLITNSNTFDNVDVTPQPPQNVISGNLFYRGEADDIYKRASVGYRVPARSPLSGPYLSTDTIATVNTSNTGIEFWIDATFVA